MKNNYFKHLFTMLLLLCATVTSAHEQKVDTTANKMAKSVGFITSIDQPDFNVDGIYYNIKGSSATVEVSSTYYFTGAGWEPSSSYSGDVVIPENVTYDGETFKVIGIRGFAFYGCKNLTSVKIPVSIESVGVEAFRGCTGLTAVYIDDLAAWCNIGFATEADLPSWASPEMSSNPLSYSNKLYLKQAGQYSLLTRLYIPFGVTKINGVAFAGSDIESVTIPNSVKVIGVGAFMECTNLRSVNLSNSVTSIEWYAFGGCTGLEEIHSLSSKPATIEEDAFTGYSATLYVPGGAKDAYEKAAYWKKFTNIVEIVDKDLEFTITSEEDATVAVSDYTGNSSSVTIPSHCTIDGKRYTVTSIGESVFSGCTSLTSIEIPNTVTSIGDYAFRSCSGLTSLEIPNSVTSIGYNAFVLCTGLKSIEIPASLTNIENSAFSSCSGLESIVVAEGNTVYDSRNNCNAIIETATNTLLQGCQNTTVPSSVTGIGHSAFYLCTGLKSIEIANSVTTIADYAFGYCEGLTSIEIPNSVTSIGISAFQNCTNLSSVVIGNGVTSIGDYAFRDCKGLTSVEIGNNVENIGSKAFYNCSSLTGELVIPNSVTSIGDYAFRDCKGLTSVEIGNNVENIGGYAFYGCSGLTGELVIPSSVTSIGNSAFQNCTNLSSVVIGNGVTSIGYAAFSGCSGLTGELVIPNSVTSIGSEAFYNCSSLTGELVIPNSVTSIESRIFYGCSGLTSVEIGNNVENIGGHAFYGCSGLTGELVIPNSVTSIESCAFEGCSGLTGGLVIPNSVTSIESRIFYGCSGLTSVEIGNNVENIGGCAFYGCSGLTGELVIPNSVTIIGWSAFEGCSGLTSVEIGNGVTFIGESAFNGCSGLTGELVIPNSVTNIGSDAFLGTVWFDNQPDGIVYAGKVLYAHKGTMPENTSVTVKEGTLSITDEAFNGCTGLASIEIPSSVTKIGVDAFYGCAELKTVVNFSELTVSKGSSSNGYIAYYADKVINAPNGFVDGEFVWGIDDDGVYVLCSYLGDATELTLPTDYKGENYKIGGAAFSGCTALTSIEIPNTVTSIGDYAFRSCEGLASLEIPNSVTSIGGSAFDGCSGLTSIAIPNSVTSIGTAAFLGCSGLKEVHVNDLSAWCNISFGGSAANPLYYAKNLYLNGKLVTELVIPDDVKEIKDYAFERCSALTSVELPVSLRSIGENAFDRCTSLVSVLICENVENIGAGAFNSCNKLKSITSLIPAEKLFAIPGLMSSIIYRRCTLYVHIGAGETYAATEGWSRFVNIVEQDLSDIEDILGEDLDNAVFYDLNGRVVEYPTNGIYIVNGKKVLVK